MRKIAIATVCAALALAGCQSYTLVQTNVFVDEDGHVVRVDYGKSGSDHVNTFVSPVTGKEMEFRSKLMIRVHLPDGDTIKAWQCMNFLSAGTMYKTDSEEWMVLMSGFGCTVYRQTEELETKYLEVYRGVMCDTPTEDVKKDDRWKPMKKTDKGTWTK